MNGDIQRSHAAAHAMRSLISIRGEIVMRRFAICFLLMVLAASARAQFDTATVLGTVTDPSGAVVAHSNVVLRNTATAAEQTAASDDRGEFRFVDVTIGTYELRVTAQGFQS